MVKDNLEGRAEILRVMGHPERLEILKILMKKEMCIKELSCRLGLTQPKVSQHIGVLKEVGVVRFRKKGTKNIYHVDSKFAEAIVKIVFGYEV